MEPHVLICGVTQTGKTTLGRKFARELSRPKNAPVLLVFDPVATETLGGDWPENALIFSEREIFMEYVHAIRERRVTSGDANGYAIFIDEADLIFSHAQPENAWLLTKGRHMGMRIFLMTQRPKMVSPSVRGQCGVVYAFRLSRTDLKMLGDDTAHNDIEKISLDAGDYLVLKSGTSHLERFNVFSQLGKRKPK